MVSEDWTGRKVRYKEWPNNIYWLIYEKTDADYIGMTYNRGREHRKLALSISFTHEYYVPIEIKVKATRLAKKMYPNAKQEGDWLLILNEI